MASKSASGLTKEQREKFLREHGFIPLRTGKGSHEQWEHPELKALAQVRKVTPPANLLSNTAQTPWECTLPSDPASGTWRSISKHADWCQETIGTAKARMENDRQRSEVSQQFHKAVDEIGRWRKQVKAHLKAGLAPDQAPETPVPYPDFKKLQEKKNQLSKP